MHASLHAGWACLDDRKVPHSFLGATPVLKSLAKKRESIICVKVRVPAADPTGPLDLHSVSHLAGASHCLLALSPALTVLLYPKTWHY